MVSSHGINSGLCHGTQNVGSLGGRLIHEERHVGITNEATIRKTFFQYSLGFFDGESANVHVSDEGQVNVAAIRDTCLGVEVGNVINADVN